MTSAIAQYERVALSVDHPEWGFSAGDVGTVVEILPHPDGGPRGIMMEMRNALGITLDVITVPETEVRPLMVNDVWSVRRMTRTG